MNAGPYHGGGGMAWNRRWIGVCVIGLSGCLVAGCADTLPQYATPTRSLAMDISSPSEPRLARLQTQDGPGSILPKPVAPTLPPLDPKIKIDMPPPPPPVPASGIQPVSLTNRGTVRISVRAWVNGRPIFDEEVMQMAGSDLAKVYASPDSSRDQKMAELINNVLEQIIDQEVMYQDAVKKLEKANPKALGQLKAFVDSEFDKTLDKWKQNKIPEDRLREMEPVARRLTERNLISTEYARSRIMDIVKGAINMELIREYYDAHKNEFQTVDKVVWQNIFIPLSPNLPTVENAKRFAEDQISKCRKREDFEKLMAYNEGPSKLNNGEGLGKAFRVLHSGQV